MFGILLWPLTAFCDLVRRGPMVSVAIGIAVTVLAFATHHGAWGSVAAMFVGFVLIWLSESTHPQHAEQGIAAGD
ncbi:hypothetical protein HB662_20600 [Roseomonas frigidaquae]|uniref:SPW repeat-containing protein n=1 Tax=Falsiroseomonas frigidaquae TaxID=487318 RepID=A0ABX1F4A8_9PROT|nr:hypothetical protein [Falsiroseomonas frigidaquae]NKE47190.1 hypothetical protein [Falsiroseomonas frigidaquae]